MLYGSVPQWKTAVCFVPQARKLEGILDVFFSPISSTLVTLFCRLHPSGFSRPPFLGFHWHDPSPGPRGSINTSQTLFLSTLLPPLHFAGCLQNGLSRRLVTPCHPLITAFKNLPPPLEEGLPVLGYGAPSHPPSLPFWARSHHSCLMVSSHGLLRSSCTLLSNPFATHSSTLLPRRPVAPWPILTNLSYPPNSLRPSRSLSPVRVNCQKREGRIAWYASTVLRRQAVLRTPGGVTAGALSPGRALWGPGPWGLGQCVTTVPLRCILFLILIFREFGTQNLGLGTNLPLTGFVTLDK